MSWVHRCTLVDPLGYKQHTVKIYTRTGDDGTTGLFGGPRVQKDHDRIEAFGTVDELNAALGVISSHCTEDLCVQLNQIQSDLFAIGAVLATPDTEKLSIESVGDRNIEQIEAWIDQHEAELSPLKSFILPGGTPLAAQLHWGRTVCRRAERRVITGSEELDSDWSTIVMYLNRLSDYLFVLARLANHRAGQTETPWNP